VSRLPSLFDDIDGLIPRHQVDGDLVLFESRAIARYIATKAKSPLVPTELHAAALFEQALATEAFNFDPFASTIVAQRVFAPMMGGKTDEARVTELTKSLEGKLEGYERILSHSKYLAGDQITIADLYHLPYGAMLSTAGVTSLEDAQKYPHVAR
jgi:glutathione S-transferase